jgi:hypothetical protein
MSGEQHRGSTDEQAGAEWRRAMALQHLGPGLSHEDCHESVLRLKAQAQCLEEVLSDIRSQIDALECEEIIEEIEEKLEAEL